MVACGKSVGIIAQRILLVVVCDGVREVDGICGIGQEGILEFNGNLLTLSFYLCLLLLWWRDDNLRSRLIDLHLFFNKHTHLPTIHIERLVGR